MREDDRLSRFLDRLTDLRGLAARRDGAQLVLTLGGESRRLTPLVVSPNLTRELLGHAVARMGDTRSWLLLPTWVSRPMAARLAERNVDYIDAAGNCHIELGSGALLHVEGRPAPQRSADTKGVRGAGLQVLFALLADRTRPPPRGDLVAAPLRTIAEASGVSRQAVSDMLARMAGAGWVVGGGRDRRWVDAHLPEAVQRWVAGYLDVLRPELFLGAWRLRNRALPEREVYEALGDPHGDTPWRWGGTMAAGALTGYYEGRRNVLHASAVPHDFGRAIGGVADPRGDFVVVAPPGPMAFTRGPQAGGRALVHRLLIHAESLVEGTERAREVAGMVLRWCEGMEQ